MRIRLGVACVTAIVCVLALSACSRNRPNVKENVSKALTQAGFEHDVKVDVDQKIGRAHV